MCCECVNLDKECTDSLGNKHKVRNHPSVVLQQPHRPGPCNNCAQRTHRAEATIQGCTAATVRECAP